MPYYLPVLLNPLINAVFNCPTPLNSSLKKVFSAIEKVRFVLIAPPTELLLEYEDLESGLPLQDLCYATGFVSDHIVLLDGREGLQEEEYKTLSGKTILLRSQQGIIFTAAAFDTRRRCRIQRAELLTNFNEYLKGDTTFPIIHVDFPLTGRLARRDEWQCFRVTKNQEHTNGPKNSGKLSHGDNNISLEQLLRINPEYGESLNDIVKAQRTSLNSSVTGTTHLASHFVQTCKKALDVVRAYPAFQVLPNLPICVHEYIELNLYDDYWAQLTNSLRDSEIESSSDYSLLKHISVSQVPSFLYPSNPEKFDLRLITQAEKNVKGAVESFRKIAVTNCHSAKAKVIIETLQTLSKSLLVDDRAVTIDADTLVSLFVVVVCHAQVKDLRSHLFYLQEFTKDTNLVTFGILAYGMSTLEAVLCYFESPEKVASLEKYCRANISLWKSISEGSIDLNADTTVPLDDLLKIRTSDGQSCLAVCLQHRRTEEFELIMNTREAWFPLEDLLHDETTDGSNLLIHMLESGCDRLAVMLINTLISNCTKDELIAFLNHTNKYQRSCGHYLMHAPQLIELVGDILNWEQRDCNGHTPLFAIVRAYDRPDYFDMVSAAYRAAVGQSKVRNSRFRVSNHTDDKGNTLLHVIKSDVSILLADPFIDVNATNAKGLTPLMVYVRYNRIGNVRTILQDQRLIIGKHQSGAYLSCFDYVKNPAVLKELGKYASYLPFEFSINVHSIKREGDEWVLWITVTGGEKQVPVKVFKRSLRFIQAFFTLFSDAHPMTFVPVDELLRELRALSQSRILILNKMDTKRFLKRCSVTLSMVSQERLFADAFTDSNLNLSSSRGLGSSQSFTQNMKTMEPEEVRSIQSILKFNLSEISALKTAMLLMKKLAVFEGLKGKDLSEACMTFGAKCKYVTQGKIQSFDHFLNVQAPKLFDFEGIANNIALCELCSSLLCKHIGQVLNDDIPKWWHTYGELLSLRREYKKSFPDANRPHVSENSGLFGSYIETKRTKLEQSYAARINHTSVRLSEISTKINQDNELLAVELNNFINFKNEFLKSAIKEHADTNIKRLREQLVCSEEALYDYKHKIRHVTYK